MLYVQLRGPMELVIRCKKCKSTNLTLIEVINPDTTNMNMDAKLKCNSCGDEAIYQVSSYYTNERREKGFII